MNLLMMYIIKQNFVLVADTMVKNEYIHLGEIVAGTPIERIAHS